MSFREAMIKAGMKEFPGVEFKVDFFFDTSEWHTSFEASNGKPLSFSVHQKIKFFLIGFEAGYDDGMDSG